MSVLEYSQVHLMGYIALSVCACYRVCSLERGHIINNFTYQYLSKYKMYLLYQPTYPTWYVLPSSYPPYRVPTLHTMTKHPLTYTLALPTHLPLDTDSYPTHCIHLPISDLAYTCYPSTYPSTYPSNCD